MAEVIKHSLLFSLLSGNGFDVVMTSREAKYNIIRFDR
jgi:hypothetical protein